MGGMYDWSKSWPPACPSTTSGTSGSSCKFFENGLAYRAKAPVNWCPKDQGVLANEQVVDGRCWRCDTPVIRRDLEQWFFKITAYADELLDFSQIEWPERVETMQKNWVGRSEGVQFDIPVDGQRRRRSRSTPPASTPSSASPGSCWRPSTRWSTQLTTPEQREAVEAYQEQARRLSEIERLSTEKEKTGVPLGTYAINPVNGERVPIWIADYVLGTYGTGAVMGVPASDERDFEFAKKYDLPIIPVVVPEGWDGAELDEAYVEPGVMVNSGQFDGLPSRRGQGQGRRVDRGAGHRAAHGQLPPARLADLAPALLGHADPDGLLPGTCGIVPVPEDELPVLLPEDAEFKPTGESPLALAPDAS